MTTTYAILLPGDENRWESTSAEDRAAMYGVHREFSELLAARGHKVVGGAELTHSREAKVVRGSGDAMTVTDGPYAESVEQLTGFYLVESDEVDDLLRIASMLGGDFGGVEVRATVDHSGGYA